MKKLILAFVLSKLLIVNSLFAQMSLENGQTTTDSSFIIRHSSFIIRHSSFIIHHSSLDTPLSINALNPSFSSSVFEKQAVKPNKITDLLTPSATFNRRRFAALVGTGTTAYVGAIALLQNLWYAQYPRGSFHRFNDDGEWLQMDKVGHIISAYHGSRWTYGAMRWTGMKNRNAAWFGMAVGTAFQATIEVLDGFSAEWGFSWGDIASNTAGCALFGVQQAVWDEQRIVVKVSNTPRNYPLTTINSIDGKTTTRLRDRTDDLYGNNYTQTFFKDYNQIVIWFSANPKSFFKDSRLPTWLNVAVGYGAENMYGGYANEWPASPKQPVFRLSDAEYPRYRQFYLSLDIDLSRVKTKSKFVNALARTFNFVKIPAPSLEFNTLGKFKFHPLMW